MDSAYAIGEEAFLTSDPAERTRLLEGLYTTLLPATDAQLAALERLHAGDTPAEYNGIKRFVRQWMTVRDLLSPTSVAGHPPSTLASRLAAAYAPVGAHLDALFIKALINGRGDQVRAAANAVSRSATPSARPRRFSRTSATWRSRRSAPQPTDLPACPTSGRPLTR